MKNFNDYLKKKLENPEIAKEYRRINPFFQLARELIKLRIKRGVTQNELALRVGSTQAVISRIESGSVNCSIGTIQKIAEALDAKLLLQVVENEIVPIMEETVIEPIYFQIQNQYLEETYGNLKGSCAPVQEIKSFYQWNDWQFEPRKSNKKETCLS